MCCKHNCIDNTCFKYNYLEPCLATFCCCPCVILIGLKDGEVSIKPSVYRVLHDFITCGNRCKCNPITQIISCIITPIFSITCLLPWIVCDYISCSDDKIICYPENFFADVTCIGCCNCIKNTEKNIDIICMQPKEQPAGQIAENALDNIPIFM